MVAGTPKAGRNFGGNSQKGGKLGGTRHSGPIVSNVKGAKTGPCWCRGKDKKYGSASVKPIKGFKDEGKPKGDKNS